MSEKSHVSMEQRMCICCGKPYDSGAILLDKRLRQSMERHTITGYGQCPDCRKTGYVTLIECDPDKSTIENNRIKPENAWKTGKVVHMRDKAFKDVFNVPLPDGRFLFVDPGVIKALEEMAERSKK